MKTNKIERKPRIKDERKKMRIHEIERIVSKITKVRVEDMRAHRGCSEWCEARSIVWYLRKKYLKDSYNKMAKEYGYKSHKSVMDGVNTLTGHMDTEKNLRDLVGLLEREVEKRISKIIFDKKRYNDHYFLKQKEVAYDAKLKMIYITEDSLNVLKKSSKKTVTRLNGNGYSVQFEIEVPKMPRVLTMPTGRQEVKKVKKQAKSTDYGNMLTLF